MTISLHWRIWLLLSLVVAMPLRAEEQPEEPSRYRLAYRVQVVPDGSAERAMIAYNQWKAGEGAGIPLDGKTPFAALDAEQQGSVRKLMESMYIAAGDGHESFANVALLFDGGLPNPSEDFVAKGYSADKIPNELSVMMAEAREFWIEDAISKAVDSFDPPIKLCRSDSGNTSSGMKSDLDQTFYVMKWDEDTQDWIRDPDLDRTFIRRFEGAWHDANGDLDLFRLDIASIEGKNRFPDPRLLTTVDHGAAVRTTIVELRLTPGAYTTYGAVLQQMQLRALAAIEAGNRRAFQQYTPDGKIDAFDRDLAKSVMFGEGMDPTIRHGMAFGAAVANSMELQHYMNAEQFLTKYHLRTWDDADITRMLVEMGADPNAKVDYTKLDEFVRRQLNAEVLERLFPGDEAARARHALALDASADLRLAHKNEAEKIPGLAGRDIDSVTPFEKTRAIFEPLSRNLYAAEWANSNLTDEQIEKLILDAEQQHRQLANEFCLRSIFEHSSETLGLIYGLDGRDPTWIDPQHVREMVQGPRPQSKTPVEYDADWEKIKENLIAESRETLLFAFYDLGPEQSAKLRAHLKAKHPDLRTQIDKLWADGKWQGWRGFDSNRMLYIRYYLSRGGLKLAELNRHAHRHVLTQLGFDGVEDMRMAGHWLAFQDVTWNWRSFAKNAFWDPGSFDAVAQVLRTFFESGGDPQAVAQRIADELFLAIPVIGQAESLRRGGFLGAGMMGLAMAVPEVGVVMVVYSVGEAGYAIYDLEYARPARENLVDAVFRGFAGPELRDYGEPGRPAPNWTNSDQEQLDIQKNHIRRLRREAEQYALDGDLTKAGETNGLIEELEEEMRPWQQRKDEYDAFVNAGSSWLGGLITGANAVEEQVFINTYLLRDVTPQLGFFTRTVVDLRLLQEDRAAIEAEIGRWESQSNQGDDINARLDASFQASEARVRLRRYDVAQKYFEAAQDRPEMMFRFRRDSLFPYLRDTRHNTTDQSINAWVNGWWDEHGDQVIAELIEAGLLLRSARYWRQSAAEAVATAKAQTSASQAGATAFTAEMERQIIEDHCPIDLDTLRARVRDELAHSRRLFVGLTRSEEMRTERSRLNVEAARERYLTEMSRPDEQRLADNPHMQSLIASCHYLAIPRARPKLEAELYQISDRPMSEEMTALAEQEFDWKVAARITADDTFYLKPYKVVPHVIGVREGQLAGATGELLDDTKQTIDFLLENNEGRSGRIVVVSAYATGLADRSKLMPQTYEHLPLVETSQGWLMDQVATFMEAPPPSVSFAGTWGCLQMFMLGPVRLQIEEGENGELTGRIRSVIADYDHDDPKLVRAYKYRTLLVEELEGRRTGPRTAVLIGVGNYRNVQHRIRLDLFRTTSRDGIEGIQVHGRYVSPSVPDDYPLRYWKTTDPVFMSPRSDYGATKFDDEDQADRERYR